MVELYKSQQAIRQMGPGQRLQPAGATMANFDQNFTLPHLAATSPLSNTSSKDGFSNEGGTSTRPPEFTAGSLSQPQMVKAMKWILVTLALSLPARADVDLRPTSSVRVLEGHEFPQILFTDGVKKFPTNARPAGGPYHWVLVKSNSIRVPAERTSQPKSKQCRSHSRFPSIRKERKPFVKKHSGRFLKKASRSMFLVKSQLFAAGRA